MITRTNPVISCAQHRQPAEGALFYGETFCSYPLLTAFNRKRLRMAWVASAGVSGLFNICLPSRVYLFVLQSPVHAVCIDASGQNHCAVLQFHCLHRGLHIFFLCHSCVLLCLLVDEYLLTVHYVEALRGIHYAATLQVVDHSVSVDVLNRRHLDARCLVEEEELAVSGTAVIRQVCLVGSDGSRRFELVEAYAVCAVVQYVDVAIRRIRDAGHRARQAVAAEVACRCRCRQRHGDGSGGVIARRFLLQHHALAALHDAVRNFGHRNFSRSSVEGDCKHLRSHGSLIVGCIAVERCPVSSVSQVGRYGVGGRGGEGDGAASDADVAARAFFAAADASRTSATIGVSRWGQDNL